VTLPPSEWRLPYGSALPVLLQMMLLSRADTELPYGSALPVLLLLQMMLLSRADTERPSVILL
jgi:hypothetical protein